MYIIISTDVFLNEVVAYLAWQQPAWDEDGYFWTFKDCIENILENHPQYNSKEHPFLFSSIEEAATLAKKINLKKPFTVIQYNNE